jgi:hypothetical protein
VFLLEASTGLESLYQAYPTPPRPTSATRDAGAAHRSRIWSSSAPRSTKSASRRKGTKQEGCGGVSGRSAHKSAVSTVSVRAEAGGHLPGAWMWVWIEPELFPTCNPRFPGPVNVEVTRREAIALYVTAAGFACCYRLCEAAQLLSRMRPSRQGWGWRTS